MRVGVISDTHGLLRPEAIEALAGSEHILHAGDIGDPEIVPKLQTVALVSAIRGNVDREAWAEIFPPTCTVSIGGRKIYMIHDLNDLDFDPAPAGFDVVVSGHSHRAAVVRRDGVLYLNPGSAGKRRFRLPLTVAILDLEDAVTRAHIEEISV